MLARSHAWAQVDVRQKREELIREEVEMQSQAQWDWKRMDVALQSERFHDRLCER